MVSSMAWPSGQVEHPIIRKMCSRKCDGRGVVRSDQYCQPCWPCCPGCGAQPCMPGWAPGCMNWCGLGLGWYICRCCILAYAAGFCMPG